MPTIAEKLAKKPTPGLQAIIAEVQQVANDSQSFAYRFEDQDDGSRLEIRCAPVPRLEQVPNGEGVHAGALAVVDGRVLRVFPHGEVTRARAELDTTITACSDVLDRDPGHPDATAQHAAATAALERLDANLAAGEQTSSHVAIPADEKTSTWLAELGVGGSLLIAH